MSTKTNKELLKENQALSEQVTTLKKQNTALKTITEKDFKGDKLTGKKHFTGTDLVNMKRAEGDPNF